MAKLPGIKGFDYKRLAQEQNMGGFTGVPVEETSDYKQMVKDDESLSSINSQRLDLVVRDYLDKIYREESEELAVSIASRLYNELDSWLSINQSK